MFPDFQKSKLLITKLEGKKARRHEVSQEGKKTRKPRSQEAKKARKQEGKKARRQEGKKASNY